MTLIGQFGRTAASGNGVLGEISELDRDLLRPHLQDIVFPEGAVLNDRDQRVEHVYFPYRGMASLMAQLATGSTIELAAIGREGVIGGLAALGFQRAFATSVVHVELGAFRIATSRLVECLPRAESLKIALAAHVERMMFQVQQLSGCNALHPIEARLARLLLRTADCLGSNSVPLTQELIAQLLGVQRTTANLVIRLLATAGAVRSRRGRLKSSIESSSRAEPASVTAAFVTVLMKCVPSRPRRPPLTSA